LLKKKNDDSQNRKYVSVCSQISTSLSEEYQKMMIEMFSLYEILEDFNYI